MFPQPKTDTIRLSGKKNCVLKLYGFKHYIISCFNISKSSNTKLPSLAFSLRLSSRDSYSVPTGGKCDFGLQLTYCNFRNTPYWPMTGFKYILSGTCPFSNWVEAEPTKAKSEECVYQALVKEIHRLGVPLKVLSNQGKEFNNNV